MVRKTTLLSRVKDMTPMLSSLRGSAHVLSKKEQEKKEKDWQNPSYRSKVLRSFNFDG